MTSDETEFFEQAQGIATRCLATVSTDAPIEHQFLEAADAYRFFHAVRGGAAVIVGRDEGILFANSSVPPVRHEEAFVAGRRTDPEVFSGRSEV